MTRDSGGIWIVQCKHWRDPVGEPAVRDFYGAMHHENADGGAIVASGGFTPQARAWAQGKPFYLYDGRRLLEIRERVRRELQGKG